MTEGIKGTDKVERFMEGHQRSGAAGVTNTPVTNTLRLESNFNRNADGPASEISGLERVQGISPGLYEECKLAANPPAPPMAGVILTVRDTRLLEHRLKGLMDLGEGRSVKRVPLPA